MTVWLLKTEPNAFSFDDLLQRESEPWDGVTSPFALAHMRNVRQGETCVIYHTGDERQAVGLGQVVRAAYQDPKQDNARLLVIDVRPLERLPRPVRLEQIKKDERFATSPLVRMGRLSVVPLSDEQFEAILEMAGLYPGWQAGHQ
jgi:predicted RNA-binding protein with PUA-like domain